MSDPDAPTPTEREEIEKLFRLYLDARQTLPAIGHYVGYGWGNLPNPLSGLWLPYSQMFEEFSREISNTINDFTNGVRSLAAWDQAIDGLSDEAKLRAVHTFIDVVATSAMGMPFVVRSRFLFAAAHLCHQANQVRLGSSWRDDLPLDDAIEMNVADTYGKPWRKYNRFKLALERISDKGFREQSRDFRNAYQHRFSPRFVIGITQLATRISDPETKRIVYGIGSRPAMALSDVVSMLAERLERVYKAFDAFRALVAEMEGEIAKNNSW